MRLPIVLIGPMGAGKSTLSRALAKRLGVRLIPLDAIRWYYHLVDGFSFVDGPIEGGFAAVVKHWEPYSIAAVERAVREFPDGVLDFGAGHAHYDDPERVLRLERALEPLPNVFLVLPSADPERTQAICVARDQARLGAAWEPSRAEVNERSYVRSPIFRRVAKHVVVVEDRSVEETLDEIGALLR